MVNPNLFAAGLDDFNSSFDRSYNRAQAMHDQRARKKSGGLLASGDQSGAAAALAEGGLIDDSRQITKDMQGQEQQQYQRGRDAEADKIALAARQLSSLKQISDGLLEAIPEDPSDPGKSAAERFAAFQKMTPVLQQLQIGGDLITQITPDMMTNQGLMAFGAQADEQMKLFSTKDGLVGYDPRKKSAELLYGVTPDPWEEELARARIDATRALVGQRGASANAANARATATRTKGAGGSGVSSSALAAIQAIEAEIASRKGAR